MKTILFIEDESALQKTLGDVLNKEGFELLGALDGEIGLRLAEQQHPDLILLDLTLPKIHGFEVLTQLKAQESTKDIPVIVLTNLEAMEGVERAVVLGATAYLVKTNYTLKDVVEKIKQCMLKTSN